MKTFIIFVAITTAVLGAPSSSTTIRPEAGSSHLCDPNDPRRNPLYTGQGSVWDYAIRSALTMYDFPIGAPAGISEPMQHVYWHNIQMMHIDLAWARVYQRLHPGEMPNNLMDQLPSRNVTRYGPQQVGEWRLDEYRMDCPECLRQFRDPNYLRNHLEIMEQNDGALNFVENVRAPQLHLLGATPSTELDNVPSNQGVPFPLGCATTTSQNPTTSDETPTVEYHYEVHDELRRR